MARPGEAYAIYLTGAGGAFLLLDVPPGSYRAEWVRPEDGGALGPTAVQHKGGLLRLPTPEFKPDAALKLMRVR